MKEQQGTASKSGHSRRKSERLSSEEALTQILDAHKKSVGKTISIRIDNRTSIEVPANMSEEDRDKRVANYLKNTNYKVLK